jgi:hypothetical protein
VKGTRRFRMVERGKLGAKGGGGGPAGGRAGRGVGGWAGGWGMTSKRMNRLRWSNVAAGAWAHLVHKERDEACKYS